MTWRDQLQPASFRGVRFYTLSHTHAGGRNIVTYEYPNSESFSTDDFGKKIKQYSIQAYLVGSDYIDQRDKLLRALEQVGAGALVHTYLGEIQAHCESWSITEQSQDGGYIELSLTFIPQGTAPITAVSSNQSFLLKDRADKLISSSGSNFLSNISILNVPEYVRGGVSGRLKAFGNSIKDQINSGVFASETAVNFKESVFSQNFASLFFEVDSLVSPSAELLSAGSNIVAAVVNVGNLINNVGTTGKSARKVFKSVRDLTHTPEVELTNNRKIQNKNSKTTVNYVKVVSVANEAKALIESDFESLDEALAARKDVIEQIDYLRNNSLFDDEFQDLGFLKAEIIATIPFEGEGLPSVQNIQLPETEPALVTSYRLYGDIDSAEDIVKRNKVFHGGFLPSNRKLQVLINE